MAGETSKRTICFSVREKDGKFAVLVHFDDDTPIAQSYFGFDTADEAKKAGIEIFDYGVYQMKGYAAEVFGGKHEAP